MSCQPQFFWSVALYKQQIEIQAALVMVKWISPETFKECTNLCVLMHIQKVQYIHFQRRIFKRNLTHLFCAQSQEIFSGYWIDQWRYEATPDMQVERSDMSAEMAYNSLSLYKKRRLHVIHLKKRKKIQQSFRLKRNFVQQDPTGSSCHLKVLKVLSQYHANIDRWESRPQAREEEEWEGKSQ